MMNNQLVRKLQTIALVLSCFIAFGAASVAQCQNNIHTNCKESILNGICCVPNLSSGYHPIKLKKGEYKSSHESVAVDNIVFGNLDNKPVAVAVLSNWTGGSGIFESLLLYDLHNKKAKEVGCAAIGDRAGIRTLIFKNNSVYLISEESHGPDAGKRTTQKLKQADFEKVECLNEALPKNVQVDVDALHEIYLSVFQNEKITDSQKLQAFTICNRHSNDQNAFAEAFRLSLTAGGYTPGKQPLSYDNSGNPKLTVVYYNDRTQTFDLRSK